MNIRNAKEYDNTMKESGKFRKNNGYTVHSWNICLECKYYQATSLEFAGHGECMLMEQEGAYNGVMATAVCNQYIDKIRGYKLDGEIVEPELHTEALRKANSGLVGKFSDMQLIKKLNKTFTDKVTGKVYLMA